MRVKPLESIVLAANDTSRGAGLHASDIYGSYYQTIDPKRYPAGSPMDWTRIALGLAWEQYLEQRFITLGLAITRPGEFKSPHGYFYNPDLFELNGQFRVGEIKLTWMSSKGWPTAPANSLPPRFDKWLTQIKLYAHELETPYATLYPYFVNGGSQRSYRQAVPEFKPLEIEFSSRELKDNFAALMQHARNERLL